MEECIDRFGGLVWSIALRLSPNRSDAEDAVQEIFIELWKKAASFDPVKASEKTFIAMVARRRLIDRMRSTGRRPQHTSLEDAREIAVNDHENMERSVEAQFAARALKTLKPEQQRVLRLSIYEGMSHSEIVEATSIPLGTVKSHIRRGLAEIRQSLSGPRPDLGRGAQA